MTPICSSSATVSRISLPCMPSGASSLAIPWEKNADLPYGKFPVFAEAPRNRA